MAAAVGDYDQDGFLDYFVTNIRFNYFMVNQGTPLGPFSNMARELGTKIFTISWGANFSDFDHDGDLDLYVANGDLNPNCTPMGNFLFQNNSGRFEDVGRASGVNDYGVGRGSVVFDIENDGDMDILLVNQEPVKDYPVASTSRLYRNDLSQGNWLKISLTGKEAETRGIGSSICVYAGELSMIREVDGGSSSHLSQNSPTVHFGLGNLSMVDSIVVNWSAGPSQVLLNQEVNQHITIEQIEKNQKGFNYRLILLLGLVIVISFLLVVSKKKKRG